jgi:hypothetical protein
MEPRISIITLGVADLARSIQFYHQGLGLPLHEASNQNIAFFILQGTWLALYPRAALAADAGVPVAGTGFTGFTLAHSVRSREAVDELLITAQAAGARLVKPAQIADWGGYAGYVADPDGFLWEIAWNPHFPIE